MINPTLERELHLQLENLRPEAQQEVLKFARSLAARPRGVPGKELLHFAGTISPEDLKLMSEAIEEGCGKVDLDAW